MGALGFEPRSAGVFRFSVCNSEPHTLGSRRVGAPVGHQTTFSIPTCRHPRATGARGTRQVILYPHEVSSGKQDPFMIPTVSLPSLTSGRLRRRSFFLRHFQRWLPRFFQAREPRFGFPTEPLYISATEENDQSKSPNYRINGMGDTGFEPVSAA